MLAPPRHVSVEIVEDFEANNLLDTGSHRPRVIAVPRVKRIHRSEHAEIAAVANTAQTTAVKGNCRPRRGNALESMNNKANSSWHEKSWISHHQPVVNQRGDEPHHASIEFHRFWRGC